MQPYVWLAEPLILAQVLGVDVSRRLAPFSRVVAYTHFGDLYLRDPSSGEFAALLQGTCTLFDTGWFDEVEFRSDYLGHPEIVEHVLRPSDLAALEARLGAPQPFHVYLPVPIPALGGSDDLATYRLGGIWEYVSFVIQSVGIRLDRRA